MLSAKKYRDDMASIMRAMQKVSDYVEWLSSTDQRFYAATKRKLRKLQEQCLQAADVFGTILGDTKAEASSPCAAEASLYTPKSVPKSDTRRYAFRCYSIALISPISLQPSNECTAACLQMLRRWWIARFSTYAESHRYKFSHVPDYIFSIVLGMCLAYEDGSLVEFVQVFDAWLNRVTSADCAWSVPYNVWKICSASDKSKYVTVSAYDVWEDLKLLYPSLFTDESLAWPLQPNAVIDYVYTGSPDLRSKLYDHYLKRLGAKE